MLQDAFSPFRAPMKVFACMLLLLAWWLPAEAATTIHYQRPAGDYDGWGLHLWGAGLAAGEETRWPVGKPFDGIDSFGRFVVVDLRDASERLGFIVHLGGTKDIAEDRFYVPEDTAEIWLRQGDGQVYGQNPDLSAPGQTVTIHYQRPSGDYDGWGLHLWGDAIAGSEATTWNSPRAFEEADDFGRYAVIRLRDPNQPINFIVHRSDQKDTPPDRQFSAADAQEIWILQGDTTIYSAPPGDHQLTILGTTYSPEATTFALWSPDTDNVQLWLDGDPHPMRRLPDADGYTEVYGVTVPGDHHLKPYNFRVNGKTARDPYGVMVEPATDRNIVIDMSRTEPEGGWALHPTLAEREDAVIYEVHVRDFTIDQSSGVDPERRGKFLGMVQRGTGHLGRTTGLDHLVELGVTHVQLMPFYDFVSCSPKDPRDRPDCYNWGYDPENYNVPEERYSQSPQDYVERIRELKTMVNEFHKAGIRVIMDVVYNHTAVFGIGGESTFSPITPDYFTAKDLSGTGNSVNANIPMVSRMIRDSLEFWVQEYHIDGFRFDLLGIFGYAAVGDWGRHLNRRFPERKLLLYGEPWNGAGGGDFDDRRVDDRVRLGTIARIADAHVAAFNPKYREAIKGQKDNGHGGGYAFNQGDLWQIRVGSRGAIRFNNNRSQVIDRWDPMFTADPEQSINYVSAHDNLSLRDKILAWAKLNHQSHNSGYLKRIQQFANGIVLTSQGVPFIHAGAEMMRHKQGDHNSYKSPDDINKIRWDWKVRHEDVFEYYKDLIGLRRAHPGLRMNTWEEVSRHVVTSQPRYAVLVNHINAAANGDDWNEIIVIFNSADSYVYALPSGAWRVAVERSDAAAGNGREVSGVVIAEGTAVTVVYR